MSESYTYFPNIPNKNRMWTVLGIEPGDKWIDVKRKYRTLIKKYHPDSAKKTDPRAFKEIQSAYEEFEAFHEQGKKQGIEYP